MTEIIGELESMNFEPAAKVIEETSVPREDSET